jgi:AraC-like DNA-binding protein
MKLQKSIVVHEASDGLKMEMPESDKGPTAMVRAEALRNFKDVVRELGGDPAELLRKSHIDPDALENANAVIPYRLMVQVLERAAFELDYPDFGMRLAAAQAINGPTKILGPLDVAMRNSPTVGEALQYCADHVHSYSTATRIYLEKLPRGGRVFMLFDISLRAQGKRQQAVEHALALTQHAIRAISGGHAKAREVRLSHEPLAAPSIYQAHFDAPIRFGQSVNGLFFDSADFDKPLPNTDPQLYEMAKTFIDQRYPAAASTLYDRVHAIVARLLANGSCSQRRVAAAMGMHPRTLQRRLREEGESFESIKDHIRRDVALQYLKRKNVSLLKVTAVLGYSETSVLSRSCHRWFSASPRKLRGVLG